MRNPKAIADPSALLDKYGVGNQETYEVTLPCGEVLTFRSVPRYADQKALDLQAVEWVRSLPQPGSAAAKASIFKECLPKSLDEGLVAFMISELSVDPKPERAEELTQKGITPVGKISQVLALKLMLAPHLVDYLKDQIDTHQKSTQVMHLSHLVEEAKKNSKPSPSENSSPE